MPPLKTYLLMKRTRSSRSPMNPVIGENPVDFSRRSGRNSWEGAGPPIPVQAGLSSVRIAADSEGKDARARTTGEASRTVRVFERRAVLTAHRAGPIAGPRKGKGPMAGRPGPFPTTTVIGRSIVRESTLSAGTGRVGNGVREISTPKAASSAPARDTQGLEVFGPVKFV